jgi:hypothetical protein
MSNGTSDTIETDEIISESGRVFRPVHKEFLDKFPPDIIKEMAKRHLEEIGKKEANKSLPQN